MPFDEIFFLEIPETEIDFFKLQYGSFKAQFEEILLNIFFIWFTELIVDGEIMEDISLDDIRVCIYLHLFWFHVINLYLHTYFFFCLQEELPDHQPRFLLYSFPHVHADSRISYPLCLIFSSPRESKTELMVMYAGSKLELEKRADVSKVYELSDLDDLCLDWLKEKLAK